MHHSSKEPETLIRLPTDSKLSYSGSGRRNRLVGLALRLAWHSKILNSIRMSKATSNAAILSISLDKSSQTHLQTQLLQALREFVHLGKLRSGERLPSSRNLALELDVSRVTTTAVYEQLIAEGYLEGRRGSGVYVVSDLPDHPVKQDDQSFERKFDPLPANRPLRPFGVGTSDLSAFPYRDWTRLHDRIWRAPSPLILGHPSPFGFGPLRNAIAEYLAEWRGLYCAPEQVIITSGLVDALGLIAKSAMNKGDRVLVEDPGHKVLINALQSCGARCVPVRVDDQGFNLAGLGERNQSARAIAVTPSRQYPLGMTLPLARRLELIAWAKRHDGLILEDDYDGEFRYQGQPLPAMMSLDEDQRVIYMGSFSKVMFPALRLGYMVVPPRLVPKIENVLEMLGPSAALIGQPVLAEFISEGYFATHIRRMRRLYGERQKALLRAIRDHADGLLSVAAAAGGMHLVADLDPKLGKKISDVEASVLARDLDLTIPPLTNFFTGTADQQGLIFGYAAYSEQVITNAILRFSTALRI